MGSTFGHWDGLSMVVYSQRMFLFCRSRKALVKEEGLETHAGISRSKQMRQWIAWDRTPQPRV